MSPGSGNTLISWRSPMILLNMPNKKSESIMIRSKTVRSNIISPWILMKNWSIRATSYPDPPAVISDTSILRKSTPLCGWTTIFVISVKREGSSLIRISSLRCSSFQGSWILEVSDIHWTIFMNSMVILISPIKMSSVSWISLVTTMMDILLTYSMPVIPWSRGTRAYVILTARISTLKRKLRMKISMMKWPANWSRAFWNTAFPRNTGPIRSFRWDCSWMRMVSRWACASIPEATMNPSVPYRQKRRCSTCSKIRTSSTVQMQGLAIPIPASSMILAEENLWSHNLSRSWMTFSNKRYSMIMTIGFLRVLRKYLWKPWRHLTRMRSRTEIIMTDISINRFPWIKLSILVYLRPNNIRMERQNR